MRIHNRLSSTAAQILRRSARLRRTTNAVNQSSGIDNVSEKVALQSSQVAGPVQTDSDVPHPVESENNDDNAVRAGRKVTFS